MKCLRNLSITQLVKLSQRFGLKPQYKNPRKRKAALIRSLREYWKNNPIGECSICWEQIQPNKLCVTPCAHLFCAECLIPYVRQSEKCPLCRTECSYAYLINRMFRIPELVSFLKSIVNVNRREEPAVIEEQEESLVVYHIIIIQRSLDTVCSFIYVFFTIFFAYYFFLLVRKGLQVALLYMNFIIMSCGIYYMLTHYTSTNDNGYFEL
jgi:hypothetical protein